jgi:photosystem I subunit 3
MKRFNFIALFFAFILAFTPDQALADIGGLTKCSESPAFSKRLKTSVKKLELRMAQYEADSPPALALQQQMIEQKHVLINIADQNYYVAQTVYHI